MKRKILQIICDIKIRYLFSILIICTCVPEDPPKGGPEDKKPPKLIKSTPQSGQKKFHKKKLVFFFDKDIKVENPYEEIKIIPHLKKKNSKYGYTYSVSGKKLTLYLKNELEKNKLYIINFGKSISSYYGNVKNENLSITFTTGKLLNNNMIKGEVVNIKTGEPLKDIYVSLYKKNRNKNILNGQPDYFIKTDSKGNFNIKYIESNDYYIYASNEINFAEKEGKNIGINILGFLHKPIKIDKSIQNIKIHAVKRSLDDIKLENQNVENGKIILKFNKEIKSYKIKLNKLPKSFKNIPEIKSILSKDKKSVTIFNLFVDFKNQNIEGMLEEDQSIDASLNIEDELGNKVTKQIKIHFGEDNITEDEFKIDIIPQTNSYINKSFKVLIATNKPIKKLNRQMIHFTLGDGSILKVDENNVRFRKYDNKILINQYILKNVEVINLAIKKGAIQSIDNDLCIEINKAYNIKTNKSTGSIKGKFYLGIDKCIVELLDKNFEIVDKVISGSEYSFEQVPEGEYTIRIFGLSNGRNKWFAGNLDKMQSPDPIFLYHTKNGFFKLFAGTKKTLKSFIIKIPTV